MTEVQTAHFWLGVIVGVGAAVAYMLWVMYCLARLRTPSALENEIRWLRAKKDEVEAALSSKDAMVRELERDLRLYQTRLAEARRAENERQLIRLVDRRRS